MPLTIEASALLAGGPSLSGGARRDLFSLRPKKIVMAFFFFCPGNFVDCGPPLSFALVVLEMDIDLSLSSLLLKFRARLVFLLLASILWNSPD